MRRLARLIQILLISWRLGLGEMALSEVRRPWARALARLLISPAQRSVPREVRLRKALEALGPILRHGRPQRNLLNFVQFLIQHLRHLFHQFADFCTLMKENLSLNPYPLD